MNTAIYIHVPFCEKKCFYCDFYSVENTSGIQRFVQSLCKEIPIRTLESGKEGAEISTIFLGGGTPSLLTPNQIEEIFQTIRKHYRIKEDAEITMECNPGTVTIDKLLGYYALGVNRLSFGVQSFIASELEFLQRIHSAAQAVEAVEFAREAGFDNISLDLMFSVPGQTLESWRYSLEKACELAPNHISAYSLIYEKRTPLFKQMIEGKIIPHDNDSDADFYKLTMDFIQQSGFDQYEVANYCKENKKSRHNLNYWYGGEYIAFGPSAHGYIDGERYWNFRSIGKYYEYIAQNELPVESTELLSKIDKLNETVLLQLRAEGLKIADFELSFGFNPVESALSIINSLIKNDLIILSDDTIRINRNGYLICDEIVLMLVKAYEKFLYQLRNTE